MTEPKHPMPGMSLRDYFAGQLAAAWLANPTTNSGLPPDASVVDLAAVVAKAGYALADAMLHARADNAPALHARVEKLEAALWATVDYIENGGDLEALGDIVCEALEAK